MDEHQHQTGRSVDDDAEADASQPGKNERIDLDRFFPYRVAIFYNAVSQSLGRRYVDLFDLTIPEWRVLAVLAVDQPLSAMEIAARSNMDKVQVSRAVTRLKKTGMISRRTDKADRRRSVIRMTDKGCSVYKSIVPLALDYESSLLDVLSPAEREDLERMMQLIFDKALQLEEEVRAARR